MKPLHKYNCIKADSRYNATQCVAIASMVVKTLCGAFLHQIVNDKLQN